MNATLSPYRRIRRAFGRLVPNRRVILKTSGLEIVHRVSLDGGGPMAAPHFARFIKNANGRWPTKFARAFEWCCGPGYIGLTLLAEGIGDRWYLADINPAAIDCLQRTVVRNRLQGRVSYCVSDNFSNISPDARFDLVVGSPPNYSGLNPRHPYYERYKDDLRPNDPGFRIHRDFYRNVKRHLNPGAMLFILEISVMETEVRTPDFAEPYDIRERPPLDDFREMIAAAGLTFLGVEPLFEVPGGFHAEMLVIKNEG
jgi:predicted RNA methylase